MRPVDFREGVGTTAPSAAKIIEFLSNSGRSLASVLSRNPINIKYPEIQERYKTVSAFYNDYKNEVEIVEISEYIGQEIDE